MPIPFSTSKAPGSPAGGHPPGVVSGALFAFITSFDELVIAIFISGSTARILPVKMCEGIRLEIDPTIAAVSSLLVALSVTLLLTLALLRRERA